MKVRLIAVFAALAGVFAAFTIAPGALADTEHSQESQAVNASKGGEISRVQNIQATQLPGNVNGTTVQVTWNGTSPAVDWWEVSRNGEYWLSMVADKSDPGKTYAVYNHYASARDAAYYEVRAITRSGSKGQPAAVLSPLVDEQVTAMQISTRVGGDATPPEQVRGGITPTSNALASRLNQANEDAYTAGQDAAASRIVAVVDVAVAFAAVQPNQNAAGYQEIIQGGESFAQSVIDHRAAKAAELAAAEAKAAYDNCRSSSSCWSGGGDGSQEGDREPGCGGCGDNGLGDGGQYVDDENAFGDD